MANTGADVSEIYQCQVCWENMLDRRPRSLKCAHSFGEDCLGRLLRGVSITCPTCRTETSVSQGVSELPIDFKLSKFKDLEKELVLNVDTVCQMCFVKGNKLAATIKCMECNRMMCDSCVHIHDKIPAVRGHRKQKIAQVSSGKVCPLHGQTVTYLCHQCMKAICLDCMFSTEHMEHNDKIEEFKPGCAKMRIKSEEILNDVVHEKAKIEKRMKQVTLDLAKMINMEQNLLEEKKKQEANIQETDEELKDLKCNYMTGAENVKQKLEDMCNALTPTCVLLEKIQEKTDEEFVAKLSQALPETEKKLKYSQEVLGHSYRMPPAKQGKAGQGQRKNLVKLTVNDLLSSKPEFSLLLSHGGKDADVSLVSEDSIVGSFESDNSSDDDKPKIKPTHARTTRALKNDTIGIIAVDLFTVIIVYFEKGKLIRMDRSGNVVSAYYVGGDEEITGACFDGEKLYIVSGKEKPDNNESRDESEEEDNKVLYNVTYFSVHSEFPHDKKSFSFYLQSDKSVPINPVVIEDNIFLQIFTKSEKPVPTNPQPVFIGDIVLYQENVSENNETLLSIWKRNIPLQTTEVILKDRFTCASLFHNLKASKYYIKKPKDCYIITCKEGIIILDSNWQILKKIEPEEGSEHPFGGLFVFDRGDFLVANGNRVCLYDSSGSFIKDVLTEEEHGIEHAAYIEVQGRRLWVLESESLDCDSWQWEDRYIRCYDYD